MYDYATEKNIPMQVTALTGCAALLLKMGAKTLHSFSGIKLARGTKDEVVIAALKNKKTMARWRKVKILVIDEVSMLSCKIFAIINRIAKLARKNDRPFGGMQVIFTGDFYQLPPVGNVGEIDTMQFCFESEDWFSVFPLQNHIQLVTYFRQVDPVFIKILSEIRVGELSPESKTILDGCLTKDISTLGDIVPTKIFPIRAKVDYTNEMMFKQILEPEMVFRVVKKTNLTLFCESGAPIPPALLEDSRNLSLTEKEAELQYLLTNSNCLEELKLKKGSLVMATYNIDTESGICNGSQGIVVRFLEKGASFVPVVRFYNGLEIAIEMQYWQSEEYPSIAIANYPLMLCWAMTIHKSQGASLDYAEIDLGKSVFAEGQTYVGLSRIRSLDGLYLSGFNPFRIKANPMVKDFYSGLPVIDYEKENSVDESAKTIEFSQYVYDPSSKKTVFF
jgi:ATP-dependent DNA helicase PIF1